MGIQSGIDIFGLIEPELCNECKQYEAQDSVGKTSVWERIQEYKKDIKNDQSTKEL